MFKKFYNLKLDLKIIYLFIYLFIESIYSLNIFVNSETKKNFEKKDNLSLIFNKEKFLFDQSDNFKINLKNNLLNSRNKLVNLIVEKKEIINRASAIEIISDSQYQIGNNYYAEGNVLVTLENGEIKADKLTYNEIEKYLILEGNISYFKGNQYIEASYLTFSFKDDKGYLKDVYGVLDLVSFSDDLGYQFEQDIEIEKRNYEANKISNVKYENIVNNTENEIKKLLNFCNLEWDENCLKFYNNKSTIKTLSVNQARKKVYSSSIDSFMNFKTISGNLFKNL